MAPDRTPPGDAPAMVIEAADGTRSRHRLTVMPIVEVPSGTSGPWLRLGDDTGGSHRDVAADALEQSGREDTIAGTVVAGSAADAAGYRWWLTGTKIVSAAGEASYLSPRTVCWVNADGEPRYDCDAAGRPAADMHDPLATVPADYRYVADERHTRAPPAC